MTDAPTFWSVALYFRERRYGGPEEGGWWYDQDTLLHVEDEVMPDWVEKCAGLCMEESVAYDHARVLNQELDLQINRHRHPLDSVLSNGIYVACVHQGWPPERDPATPPYYE